MLSLAAAQCHPLDMDEPLPGTGDEACESALIASLLDPDERCRAARFIRPGDGRRWARVRARLRQLLGERCGLAPGALRFATGPHGKPALAENPASWRFNVSHARRHALIALARHDELGVDIERLEPARDTAALVDTVFDEAERRAFAALPGPVRDEAFTRVWVRKEAVLKALGTGIGFGLQRVHVGLGPVPALRIDAQRVTAWRLDDLAAPPGHLAALCRAGQACAPC